MTERLSDADPGRLEVAYILLLLQGAMGLLSGAAMLLLMGGNPIALPLALGVPLFVLAVAAGVSRGSRWARRAAMAIQAVVLLGFAAGVLISQLTTAVGMSLTVMTLVTNLALPAAVIALLRPIPAAVAVAPDGRRVARADVVADAGQAAGR